MKAEFYLISDGSVIDRISLDEAPATEEVNPAYALNDPAAVAYCSWVMARTDISPFGKRRKLANTLCDDLEPTPDLLHGCRRVDDWAS